MATSTIEKRYYSVVEVSEMTGISVPTIRRYIDAGTLRCLKVQGRVLIPSNEFNRWIDYWKEKTPQHKRVP